MISIAVHLALPESCKRNVATRCQLTGFGVAGISMPSLSNERVATLCYGTGESVLAFAQSRIGGSMYAVKVPMLRDKKIALVAHDNKKHDLLEWASFNRDLLAHHEVYATGTTGGILERRPARPHTARTGILKAYRDNWSAGFVYASRRIGRRPHLT